MQTLEGLFAPLATPFTDDASSVSEVRFARQIRHMQTQPVNGFVVCSDCGEFGSLSSSERKQLVEWVARMSNGMPFLVHISSLSTSTSLDLGQHAARHGARAVTLMPPYYGVFTADELVTFFKIVAKHSGVPIIVVDPLGAITQDVRAGLHDVSDLLFGRSLEKADQAALTCHKGPTASDEFAVGDCICSPLALLAPKQVAAAIAGQPVDLTKLIILEETLGRSRVSKAGLEALGIEVGPPRPPVKPLGNSVEMALKTMLSQWNAPPE